MTEICLQIKHWDEHFENSGSKKFQSLAWVAYPCELIADFEHEIMDRETEIDDLTIIVFMHRLIRIARRGRPGERGKLITNTGKRFSIKKLARETFMTCSQVEKSLEMLIEIGFLTTPSEEPPKDLRRTSEASSENLPATKQNRTEQEQNNTGQNKIATEEGNNKTQGFSPSTIARFEELFKDYPLKQGLQRALKAYAAMDEDERAMLINATCHYLEARRRAESPEYSYHISTFVEKHWTDWVEPTEEMLGYSYDGDERLEAMIRQHIELDLQMQTIGSET